jgi:hypothetical protein
MRVSKALCCAAALTTLLATSARADEWNKKTILTFSGPVQIPGASLPAGSYVFKLADIPGNRHVVQVFDKDEKKIFTTLLAIPNERLEPSDKPVVLFSERATGSPQAVKVWYYPGERTGNEFVYPKSQAMRIAKETHQRVLAMNSESSASNTAGEVPESMKTAELGYFDETGNWQTSDQRVAVNSDRPAPSTSKSTTFDRNRPTTNTAESTTSRNNMASKQTAGTSGSPSVRRHLPRTASSLVLFELLSGLAIAAGFAVRQLRERSA